MMTKFLCIDFDGTLSDPRISSLVKRVVESKKSKRLESIKIGIVTSRSIYDDFITDGQFDHDIVEVLTEHRIELDFICTRFCLHLMCREDYAKYDIPTAIERANKVPIFGETPSDYLFYRAAHHERIEQLKLEPTPEKVTALKTLVKDDIAFELSLRATYIEGQMPGEKTPKINQIETTLASLKPEASDAQVFLLDDADKHVRALDSYSDKNWEGCLYTGDIKHAELSINQFLASKQTLTTNSTCEGDFSENRKGLRLRGIFQSPSNNGQDRAPSEKNRYCIVL